MKITILGILLSFFILSCSNSIKSKQLPAYFEGEIHYTVKYQSLDGRFSNDFLVKEYGDTLIGKFKEDKYLMKQNTKGKYGSITMIYRLEESFVYYDYLNSDTIFRMDISEKEGELLDFKRNPDDQKNILGRSCESISLSYQPKDKNSGYENISATYHFDPALKLNPEKYKNFNTSYQNLIVKEAKSINLRTKLMNRPYFTVLYEAYKIIPKKIEEKEFSLKNKKVIVGI